MADWVKLCKVDEAPEPDCVIEASVGQAVVCLANVGGSFAAMHNRCPHRGAPLGQGWIEGQAVICPWHSWAFHTATGHAEYPTGEKVSVFPLRVEGDVLLIFMDAE